MRGKIGSQYLAGVLAVPRGAVYVVALMVLLGTVTGCGRGDAQHRVSSRGVRAGVGGSRSAVLANLFLVEARARVLQRRRQRLLACGTNQTAQTPGMLTLSFRAPMDDRVDDFDTWATKYTLWGCGPTDACVRSWLGGRQRRGGRSVDLHGGSRKTVNGGRDPGFLKPGDYVVVHLPTPRCRGSYVAKVFVEDVVFDEEADKVPSPPRTLATIHLRVP